MAYKQLDIPVVGDPYTKLDQMGTIGTAPVLYNITVDHNGPSRRAPGLTLDSTTATNQGIDGMYWWGAQSTLVVVANGHIFKKTTSAGSLTDVTGTATDLEIGNKCSFADFGTKLVIANGGGMKVLPASGGASDIVDAEAPTSVSHVAAVDGYCVAYETSTGYFHWSLVGDVESWDAEYNTPQQTPTRANGMHRGWGGELTFTKPDGIEIWRSDGSAAIFVPNRNALHDVGVAAPDSFVLADRQWVFISDQISFVRLEGRQPVQVSKSLDILLQTYFSDVSDIWASYVPVRGQKFVLLRDTGTDTTILVDIETGIWCFLNRWTNPNWLAWRGQLGVACPDWGKTLIGDYTNGLVYDYTYTAGTYYDDNIRGLYRTGWDDRGYPGEKRSYGLKLFYNNMAAGSPSVEIRWRDNGSASFGNWLSFVFADTDGEAGISHVNMNLGSYYARQWEIEFDDNATVLFVMNKLEELVEVSHI